MPLLFNRPSNLFFVSNFRSTIKCIFFPHFQLTSSTNGEITGFHETPRDYVDELKFTFVRDETASGRCKVEVSTVSRFAGL